MRWEPVADRPGRMQIAVGAAGPDRDLPAWYSSYGSETLVPSPLLEMVKVPAVATGV